MKLVDARLQHEKESFREDGPEFRKKRNTCPSYLLTRPVHILTNSVGLANVLFYIVFSRKIRFLFVRFFRVTLDFQLYYGFSPTMHRNVRGSVFFSHFSRIYLLSSAGIWTTAIFRSSRRQTRSASCTAKVSAQLQMLFVTERVACKDP